MRRSKSVSEDTAEYSAQSVGPLFRHVYNKLFGPTYPGEYIPPGSSSEAYGTYVLSYPGVSFSFPLKHNAWSEQADFVSLLSSSAALAATSMSIFHGASWPETRSTLFTKPPPYPRSIALSGRNKDFAPTEVELVSVQGDGTLEFMRKGSTPFVMVLGKTTPQDLVTELGPPDAVFRKSDTRITIHGVSAAATSEQPGNSSSSRAHSKDSHHSSPLSCTGESDSDLPSVSLEDRPLVNPECFYNYFHHGFDALVSFPGTRSPTVPGSNDVDTPYSTGSNLVVTKIMLHANAPGSHSFNRHRRSRWTIDMGPAVATPVFHSEMTFEEISNGLKGIWTGTKRDDQESEAMRRGMVLNRGWGESPGSSVELLGGFGDGVLSRKLGSSADESASGLGNTQLFGFPGLLFEVLKNGWVSCLTVY